MDNGNTNSFALKGFGDSAEDRPVNASPQIYPHNWKYSQKCYGPTMMSGSKKDQHEHGHLTRDDLPSTMLSPTLLRLVMPIMLGVPPH